MKRKGVKERLKHLKSLCWVDLFDWLTTHTHTEGDGIVSFGKLSFINNSTWVAINLWWFSMKRQHTLINQWDYRTIFHDLTSISVSRTNSLCRSLTVIAHESEICFQNVNGAICNLTDSGKMPFNYLFTLHCQLEGWEVRQKREHASNALMRSFDEKFRMKIKSAQEAGTGHWWNVYSIWFFAKPNCNSIAYLGWKICFSAMWI